MTASVQTLALTFACPGDVCREILNTGLLLTAFDGIVNGAGRLRHRAVLHRV